MHSSRSGQSLIESCFVIAILCLVLFGGLQVSQIYVAREVLDHAAVCGARARAVGLNDFMVQKTISVAAIPLAGNLISPRTPSSFLNPYAIEPNQGPNQIGRAWNSALFSTPNSTQFQEVERGCIPLYLGAATQGQLPGILNYELDYWNQYGWDTYEYEAGGKNIVNKVDLIHVVNWQINNYVGEWVQVHLTHQFPLNFAFHRAIPSLADSDVLTLTNTIYMDRHYDLYLE